MEISLAFLNFEGKSKEDNVYREWVCAVTNGIRAKHRVICQRRHWTLKEGGLRDPTSIEDKNSFLIKVWKSISSEHVLKPYMRKSLHLSLVLKLPINESSNKTISVVSSGFGLIVNRRFRLLLKKTKLREMRIEAAKKWN